MSRQKAFLSLCLVLVLALACNLPSATPTETAAANPEDLELTITALASGQGNQPSDSPAQDTATPEFTPITGPTSTPTVPQVTVSQNTNCRVGPGVVYDLIDAVLIGQTAEVVGKNSGVPNYWVVKRLNGSGTCWLWGQYATVSGNTANLPEYPVPPTPTPSPTPTFTPTPTLAPPAPVNNVSVVKNCIPLVFPTTYTYTGILNWEDKSNNENGFNIYFNGALFASIPANSNSYPLPALPFASGTPVKWGVEAFNSAGKAAIKDVIFTCP